MRKQSNTKKEGEKIKNEKKNDRNYVPPSSSPYSTPYPYLSTYSKIERERGIESVLI